MATRLGALRGLSYPATRARGVTRQLMLLQGAGEEEFTRWVKARARFYDWQGWHVRDSEGALESIHTLRLDGFCEGLGIPDWFFWHEERGDSFWAELKGATGHLSKWQQREIPSMRRGGAHVFIWYPRDASSIERIFRDGLEEFLSHG